MPAALTGDTVTRHILMKLADELKLREKFNEKEASEIGPKQENDNKD